MFRHEDSRRVLHELTGEFKTVKFLIAKDGCVVGDHYHNNKDENFVLVSGAGTHAIEGLEGEVELFKLYYCPAGVRHTFRLEPGSILIGTATQPFDINDEIK